VLTSETIADLKEAGIKIEVGKKTNYKTDKKPVKMEYIDDITTKDFTLVPTWKRLSGLAALFKNQEFSKAWIKNKEEQVFYKSP